MISLSSLRTPRTPEQMRAQLMQALQGVGFVRHTGTGTGSLAASGNGLAAASVVVEIVTSGSLGTATFRVSSDGGSTFGAAATVPTSGQASIPALGVSLLFAGGMSTPAFVAGDRYAFQTAPALPVGSLPAGNPLLCLIDVSAPALSSVDRLIAEVASAGFLDLAEGAWLDLLARQVYGLECLRAKRTRGNCTLTAVPTAGPYDIAVGQLRAMTNDAKRFVNITAGVLRPGETLVLEFQAEDAGGAWNVLDNAITQLATPLPGVSINNPGPSKAWITEFGQDAETNASLRARCRLRWAELSVGATSDTYEAWARASSTSNARVLVEPSGDGQVIVYVAPLTGGAAEVVPAQAYIQARAPMCVSPLVIEAMPVAVPLEGPVKVRAGMLDSARAAASAAVKAYFDGCPIGGYELAGGKGLSRSRIVSAIATQEGVLDLDLLTPPGNVLLEPDEWPDTDATLSDLTWIEV